MEHYTNQELDDALQAISKMISRSENAQEKFAPGTSQHTLQKNRIHALHLAKSMIANVKSGNETPDRFTRDELERASAPLRSLISKSEKAQAKLAPGSWQHTMLENNLKALRIAAPLLEKSLPSRL